MAAAILRENFMAAILASRSLTGKPAQSRGFTRIEGLFRARSSLPFSDCALKFSHARTHGKTGRSSPLGAERG